VSEPVALSPQQEERILSVAELTRSIQSTLRESYPALWVKGEISGFKRAASGHFYFSLKDREAVLTCAMWKGATGRLTFDPRDGAEVEAFGEIDVYLPRGQYQLIIQQMRPAGLGALLLALEELKRKLTGEGLFEASRKRAVPRYPRTVGLVTSPTGAAVRDMIKVLRRRWPGIRIVLAPVRVQGMGAAAEITAAIERFNHWGGADVIIVGRGGGSLEDLWAFNEEPVVRAIASSHVPVVSAVGHEVDVTLADHAADVRAATPSHAAELVVRDAAEIRHRIEQLSERHSRSARLAIETRRRALEELQRQYGFRRVRDLFTSLQQQIDETLERAASALHASLRSARERLDSLARAYGLREFPRALARRREALLAAARRLTPAAVGAVHAERRRLAALEDRLRALSPRAVLERGFALVRTQDGALVRAAGSLAMGEHLVIEFARGEADAVVERIRKGGEHAGEEERRR
jgi:exodeoxyribonuclease VII large subunit